MIKNTRRSYSVYILEAGLEIDDRLKAIRSLQTVFTTREAVTSFDLPEEDQRTNCVLKELAQNHSSVFSAGGSAKGKNCARDA